MSETLLDAHFNFVTVTGLYGTMVVISTEPGSTCHEALNAASAFI